jgi:hypothetical protein
MNGSRVLILAWSTAPAWSLLRLICAPVGQWGCPFCGDHAFDRYGSAWEIQLWRGCAGRLGNRDSKNSGGNHSVRP